MKTLLRPALAVVLLLVVAACADPSGQPWTPPPAATPAAETAAPASVAPSAAASVAPSSAAASAAPSAAASAPAESAVPSGRVIELELTGALEIKENGAKVTDIPVTPGETVTFRITNTAGFAHNFWIGTDAELAGGQVTGLTGIPEWSDAEPKEVTWVVPADVTGLKFGCTVPGHYTLMQGTFSATGPATSAPATSAPATSAPATSAPATSAPATSAPATSAPASVAPASAAPASSVAPASAVPSAAASVPASSQEPAGRVVELQLTGALAIEQNGVKVTDIPVTPGETIVFKLTNTAGFAHNFWIGPDQALMSNQTTGLTGVPEWSDAEAKELTWVVPDDVTDLKFGCTVPGHYTLMNGTFSVAS